MDTKKKDVKPMPGSPIKIEETYARVIEVEEPQTDEPLECRLVRECIRKQDEELQQRLRQNEQAIA